MSPQSDQPSRPVGAPGAGGDAAPSDPPVWEARRRRRAVGDRAMQRAVLLALVVGLVLDAIVITIAAVTADGPALIGALIGTGLTLVVVLPTLVIAVIGRRMTPVTMAAGVLGSWAVKMLIVILVLIVVRDLASVSTRWIGLALLVGAVSAVTVEVTLLMRSRQPLDVEPVAAPPEDDA
ncbi:hypothetical protein ACTXKZ_13590 [Brachybacterium alimentarium]|uniref:hypothetical protein n=1 Tax=Brachybacterium alimentarium TaxID=47845 RepID=UPI003FD5A9A0